MAKTKEGKETEVLEKPVETTKKGEKETTSSTSKLDFDSFFDKNKKLLAIVFGVLLLAGAGYGAYTYLNAQSDKDAQAELFIPENYFQQDSFDLALNGDKVNRGLLDIADEYGSTNAGNLANYYIGVIYLKKGKYEEAVEYLKKFSSGDLLVQARAYSLIGDAYQELKDAENAASYYKKAADNNPNEYFTPRYLLKLAWAYESNKDYESAIKAYDRIIEEFSKSQEYNDARKYKARAEQLIAE